MIQIFFNQNFHGIGQGLFYSGRFDFQSERGMKSTYNFIYDCGTKSKRTFIEKEIVEYKTLKLQKKEIELLMISHLDSDHVNGLDELLENTWTHYVILPYLSPIERLIISIQGEAPEPPWYFDFLSNPTQYLKNHGVENIIYITRGKDSEYTPPEESRFVEFEISDQMKMDFEKMSDDNATRKKAESEDNVSTGNVMFKKDDRPAILSRIWQFFFFTAPIQVEKLKKFLSEVEEFKRDESIHEIISNKTKRDRLKEIYKKTIKENLNITSLACLHGPISQFPFIDNKFSSLYPFTSPFPSTRYFNHRMYEYYREFLHKWSHEFRHRIYDYLERVYYFLLGDINSTSEWEHIQTRYSKFFRCIHTFQIPHHGSGLYWNNAIPHEIGPCDYILSAGLHNTHKHPDLEVIQNISESLSPDVIKWAHEYRSQTHRREYLVNF